MELGQHPSKRVPACLSYPFPAIEYQSMAASTSMPASARIVERKLALVHVLAADG